jgi:hypothetical protein
MTDETINSKSLSLTFLMKVVGRSLWVCVSMIPAVAGTQTVIPPPPAPAYSIASTAPDPVGANRPFTVTIRFTPPAPPATAFCPNIFQAAEIKTVMLAGNTIVLARSQGSVVSRMAGSALFCEDTLSVSGLPPNTYNVELRQPLYDVPTMPVRIISLGSICIGACPTQSVPLNFSAGAPLWWVAIASLFGFGGYTVRQRGLHRKK